MRQAKLGPPIDVNGENFRRRCECRGPWRRRSPGYCRTRSRTPWRVAPRLRARIEALSSSLGLGGWLVLNHERAFQGLWPRSTSTLRPPSRPSRYPIVRASASSTRGFARSPRCPCSSVQCLREAEASHWTSSLWLLPSASSSMRISSRLPPSLKTGLETGYRHENSVAASISMPGIACEGSVEPREILCVGISESFGFSAPGIAGTRVESECQRRFRDVLLGGPQFWTGGVECSSELYQVRTGIGVADGSRDRGVHGSARILVQRASIGARPIDRALAPP